MHEVIRTWSNSDILMENKLYVVSEHYLICLVSTCCD